MDGSLDPSGLSRSLEEAMRLLRQATSPGEAQPGMSGSDVVQADADVLVGRGVSGNGLVEAEVSAGGRLESLVMDPSLLRQGTTAIAQHVVEAVRAAQDDERARRTEALGQAVPDTTALAQQLERVSEDAFRGFSRMISDLDAATRRLNRG